MSAVVLTILGDATGARRAISEVREEAARATAVMGSDSRKAAAERRRDENEEIAGARRQLKALADGRRRSAEDRRRGENEEITSTRAQLRALHAARVRAMLDRKRADDAAAAQRRRDEKAEVTAQAKNERDKTKASTREAKLRETVARAEAKAKEKATNDEAKAVADAEKEKTKAAEREEKRRTRLAETESRARVRAQARAQGRSERERNGQITGAIGGAGRAGLQLASTAHGMIQDLRERNAVRETDLNSTLIQTGAGLSETPALRARIMEQIRAARLNPDDVIPAIGEAQSFANALGGENAGQRRAAIDATMNDVRFASLIDPNSIGGLVRVGALTRGKMNETDRSALLRSFAGISFQGSVETDEMITRGLPGLQEAWSTGTANITDPTEASRRRLEIARDFAAQVQAQAASGRSTGVAANRSNTVRTALSNADRQNRLGQAYARRASSFTPEQRELLARTFTRGADGKYTMNEEVRSSASNAARFFGTMHNNDATQMRNFLGAHGGGGNRQLMLTPDVNALSSYLAMTTNARGQQVRQYDYVNELQRSTITPEREREIAAIRATEDRGNLNANENARAQALTENTGSIKRLSDSFAAWTARNPIVSAGLAGIAAPVLSMAAKAAPKLLGQFGARATPVLGAALTAYDAVTDARQGRSIGQVITGAIGNMFVGGSTLGRAFGEGPGAASAALNAASGATQAPTQVSLSPNDHAAIGQQTAAALRATPITATVSPLDAAHAASSNAAPRSPQ